jgi:hypothetical protein
MSRRSFVRAAIAIPFVTPVIASFTMDSFAAPADPQFPNQHHPNQWMPNQQFPNQQHPYSGQDSNLGPNVATYRAAGGITAPSDSGAGTGTEQSDAHRRTTHEEHRKHKQQEHEKHRKQEHEKRKKKRSRRKFFRQDP